MKNVLPSNMFWILMIILFFHLYSFNGIGTWNLNRTIGWGWEFELYRWINAITKSSIFLFTIGYGILKVYRRVPHFAISILHLFLILTSLWIPKQEFIFNIIFGLLTWGVFFGNFIFALKNKE